MENEARPPHRAAVRSRRAEREILAHASSVTALGNRTRGNRVIIHRFFIGGGLLRSRLGDDGCVDGESERVVADDLNLRITDAVGEERKVVGRNDVVDIHHVRVVRPQDDAHVLVVVVEHLNVRFHDVPFGDRDVLLVDRVGQILRPTRERGDDGADLRLRVVGAAPDPEQRRTNQETEVASDSWRHRDGDGAQSSVALVSVSVAVPGLNAAQGRDPIARRNDEDAPASLDCHAELSDPARMKSCRSAIWRPHGIGGSRFVLSEETPRRRLTSAPECRSPSRRRS